MPYSLVLHLHPRSPISTLHLSGRHLHALFLDLVRSLDPDLATALHQQTTDKAFTLSPLQVAQRRSRPATAELQWQHSHAIPAGTPCWWRISLLDEGLFGSLSHLWLGLNPNQPWQLGATELQVVRVLGTSQPDQPWANFTTYARLYEGAADGTGKGDRKISLHFCTPMAFRQRDYDCALPAPEAVFRSLWRRWNCYSGIPFDEEILECVYPSFFDIRTELVADSRSKFIGCVGTVVYQLLGEVAPAAVRQLNALADYALYAGVGRKTPMGMGMVRRDR
ncbi:CRISPR-associated endoribonuclease Cas6 [bacterium]|nr:CRISPR-associated endoribonuclease Cas6 [bacterium]